MRRLEGEKMGTERLLFWSRGAKLQQGTYVSISVALHGRAGARPSSCRVFPKKMKRVESGLGEERERLMRQFHHDAIGLKPSKDGEEERFGGVERG